MKKNQKSFLLFTSGLLLGLLLAIGGVCLWQHTQSKSAAQMQENAENEMVTKPTNEAGTPEAPAGTSEAPSEVPEAPSGTPEASDSTANIWLAESIYTGGDEVAYHGKIYRAKWWTQNEEPGKADVWEDTLVAAMQPASDANQQGNDADQQGNDADQQGNDAGRQGNDAGQSANDANQLSTNEKQTAAAGAPGEEPVRRGDFKVIGYFPSWKESTEKIQYDVLTHINYAFAIPTSEGTLLPLENAETAEKIIKEAHQRDVKVFIAVGGWSYHDVPLESTFVSATETKEKRTALTDALLALCEEYGFDGVDLDWEHPRVDGDSSKQYESLVVELADRLHAKGKELSSAVLSGVTADGNVYYDAAAHTDNVLETVDWINVMAYDGGDGERHSSYDFAVNCGTYWTKTRGMPAKKVMLGVPFYARPSWAAYGDILAAVPDAWKKDHTDFNGMDVWYNGVSTIEKKTAYALNHLGGVMIWEISQDASGEYSLQTAIKSVIK